jgi:hypothetical protein
VEADEAQPVDAVAKARTAQDDDTTRVGLELRYEHGGEGHEQGLVSTGPEIDCGGISGSTTCATTDPVNDLTLPD